MWRRRVFIAQHLTLCDPLHCLQQQLADSLAEAGYCFSCAPAGLAATLQGMDPGRLKPYEPGDPRQIAGAIDQLMGFCGRE